MLIGLPKEIKNNEYRVGMIPAAVRELTARGHTVFIETNAADAIDLSDAIYARAGAVIPLDPIRQYTGGKTSEPLTIRICRGADGVCDAAETCDGSSPACPADVFSSSATV